MTLTEEFWEAYFGQGVQLWESGRALEILHEIPGRQAQRCIAALREFSSAEQSVLQRLMLDRFKSSVVSTKFRTDPAQESLLANFDTKRLQPAPQESVIAKRISTREVRKVVKSAFSDAAVKVFGAARRGEAGERHFQIALSSRMTWRPVLSFGSATTQATYWATITDSTLSRVALNVLCQIGVSGSTDWDLIGTVEEAHQSAKAAEAIWSAEVDRMRQLMCEVERILP
jgi:hypothetical protein